jgi:glutamate---cysteine ligase / carboxylate-amine ligase
MSVRRVGVEEELLLVDPGTGRLAAVSDRALAEHRGRLADARRSPEPLHDLLEPDVEQELYRQQIETGSAVVDTLRDLRLAIGAGRRAAGEAAHAAGVSVAAVAAPVLDAPAGEVTGKSRYQRMLDTFGEIARGVIVCGMHTHVDVAGEDEAVAVVDRLRPWLPVLLALSGNSPFFAGRDTGYHSWRSQLWRRWPTATQGEPFGDAAGYHAAVDALIESGAAMDRGMVYLDARPSARYPTVEVRVADVCLDVDDAVLVAALVRGLVETAARDAHDGEPVPRWRSELLAAARWRAGRDGISGDLLDPTTQRLAGAGTVVRTVLDYTESALRDAGDLDTVQEHLDRLFSRGTGAARQRAVFRAAGNLEAVMCDVLSRTAAF